MPLKLTFGAGKAQHLKVAYWLLRYEPYPARIAPYLVLSG